MQPGQIVSPSPGERLICVRSGQDGGPFVFELELAPKMKGPPTHSHDEGDETIEVLEGEIAFRIGREVRTLRAGDTLTLTPEQPHTFWNPSPTEKVRCRVTHGARFERAIEQPGLMALAMYLSHVDPGASRTTRLAMRVALRIIALVGRLRGIRPLHAP